MRLPRDPDALVSETCVNFEVWGEERTGTDDFFRWLDPSKAERMMRLVSEASLSCFADQQVVLELSLRLKRILGDPSGRWLPYTSSGRLDDVTSVKGWLAIARENIDGGLLEFRSDGGEGGGTTVVQKELCPGMIILAEAPLEWRIRPVFSWDNTMEGTFDIIEWDVQKLTRQVLPDATNVAYSSLLIR